MTEHNIFYYPYASFGDEQAPLLKVAALYFDKLFLLDPEKASGGTIGIGQAAKDVKLLEQAGILVRVSPEEVLYKYDALIGDSIRSDINDPDFMRLCEQSGREKTWRLALAKIPKSIRHDPQFEPLDDAMRNLMGQLPHSLAPDVGRYTEVYNEVTQPLYAEFGYDEARGGIEYRYHDYPLPIGESIMVNHALFGGLLLKNATPVTDDRFHEQVLAQKIQRARQIPEVRRKFDDWEQARQIATDRTAAETLRDPFIKLPILNPELPMEELLEYRDKHGDELKLAREKLGKFALSIHGEPWSDEFERSLRHETVKEIADALDKVRETHDEWLKSKRAKLALKAVGIAAGTATAVLAIVITPLTPIALATAGVALTSSTIVPGLEWLTDLRDGKKTDQENGLRYLLMYKH